MSYQSEAVKKTQKQKRALIRRFKKFHGCSCGERDPNSLDLHHIDAATKLSKLSKSSSNGRHWTGGGAWQGLSFAELEIELAKCEVVCANCHRKITAAERGWGELDKLEPSKAAIEAAIRLGIAAQPTS